MTRAPSPSLVLGIYTAQGRGPKALDLEAVFPSERTRFFAYGRQALAEALRAAGIKFGDRVLVPGLICRELPASVASVGAVVEFYPIDEGLRLMIDAPAFRQGEAVKAVVAVNYFGFPQPLEPLRAWCQARGAVLIEDNAHGFLSEDAGCLLGRRGDLGVFSLRKTLPLPNGAALVDNREEPRLAEALAYHASPWAAEFRYTAKTALKRLMAVGGLPMAGLVRQILRGFNRCSHGGQAAMTQERMSTRTLRLLSRCHATVERDRRRTLYQHVEELLRLGGVQPVFSHLPIEVAPYAYPFYAPKERMPAVRRLLGSRGLMETSWPELPDSVAPSSPPHYKMLRCVPFLW